MMRRHVVSLLAFALLLTPVSGCLWAPELDRVREEIEGQIPGAHFEREFALSLGPLSLGLAQAIVRWVPDAAEARGYLKEIRRVKVAVYRVENVPRGFAIRMPARLRSLLDGDWEVTVKVRVDNDGVWVLHRAEGETIEGLYLVVLSADQLVLVRADGKIERLLAKAMRDHGQFAAGGALETL